jgi:hypothetical protein
LPIGASPLKLGLEPVKAVFSATLASAMGLMVKATVSEASVTVTV